MKNIPQFEIHKSKNFWGKLYTIKYGFHTEYNWIVHKQNKVHKEPPYRNKESKQYLLYAVFISSIKNWQACSYSPLTSLVYTATS
jgi:hypothetical protein